MTDGQAVFTGFLIGVLIIGLIVIRVDYGAFEPQSKQGGNTMNPTNCDGCGGEPTEENPCQGAH